METNADINTNTSVNISAASVLLYKLKTAACLYKHLPTFFFNLLISICNLYLKVNEEEERVGVALNRTLDQYLKTAHISTHYVSYLQLGVGGGGG